MEDLFAELKKRKVFRVVIGYAALAWVTAQVAEFAFDTFGAPDWALKSLVIVLALGLPIAAFLAWALEVTPEGIRRERDGDAVGDSGGNETSQAAGRKGLRRGPIVVVISALLAAGSWLTFDDLVLESRQIRYDEALQRAAELNAQDRYGEAFAVLNELRDDIGEETAFVELWDDISIDVEVQIFEEGIEVSFRPYSVDDAAWVHVGTTPLQAFRAPYGVVLLKLEKPGFQTRLMAAANNGPFFGNVGAKQEQALNLQVPEVRMIESGAIPENMVAIPATKFAIYMLGYTRGTFGDDQLEIPGYAMQRMEVSNRHYKEFVDADGYSSEHYWKGMTLADGSPLTADLIATFVDRSNRPGPSEWEFGSFDQGTGDLPVGGISLYEARAYARFRGLALPTIHHWARAAYAPAEAALPTAPAVEQSGHFDPDGPQAVHVASSIGPWGTYNTAGNVREWVWNTTTDGEGLALGGSYADYSGLFQHAYTIDPMNRSPQNGVRLMHTLGEPIEPSLLDPIEMNTGALSARREPVSDDVFEAMRFQFTHVRQEPLSVTREIVSENDTWRAEEVILAYPGGREFTLYVVMPAYTTGPYQPVIYKPHSGALNKIPNRELLDHLEYMEFVVRSGRALILPVWDHTAQRYTPFPGDDEARADFTRRLALAWYEDAATTIDYLEMREDINADAVGFAGISWGAYKSPQLLALEDRFAAAVLIAGGAPYWSQPHPMFDPVNYLPRVTLPVLMINGRYDHLFLLENSQQWMYELLGTPDADKKHVIYDIGHFDFPRNQVARESSDWFDEHLGTPRPSN